MSAPSSADSRLCGLVAHHSGAAIEAKLRGLTDPLPAESPQERVECAAYRLAHLSARPRGSRPASRGPASRRPRRGGPRGGAAATRQRRPSGALGPPASAAFARVLLAGASFRSWLARCGVTPSTAATSAPFSPAAASSRATFREAAATRTCCCARSRTAARACSTCRVTPGPSSGTMMISSLTSRSCKRLR